VSTTPRGGRAPALPAEERRAAIVAAALPLVRAQGAAVSTRQIAEVCGIAEGTIFRVFEDKDSLLRAVVARAFDTTPLLDRLAAIDRSAPLEQRLEAAVTAMQEHLTELFDLIGALHTHLAASHDQKREAVSTEAQQATLDAVASLIEPDAAQLRRTPRQVAELLRLLTFSANHPRIVGGSPLPASEVVSVVLDGVRTTTGRSAC
jgi:AcrR family transcriptional regulator